MAKPLAIICMQKNEGMLLKCWILHHAKFFGISSLFIIDNGSTDPLTIDILSWASESGSTIINASSELDFEKKGDLVSNLIALKSSEYHWFAPLDCDEMLVLFGPNYSVTTECQAIKDEIERLGNTCAQIARISQSLTNIPGTNLAYPLDIKKVLVKSGANVKLDMGFHMYSWHANADIDCGFSFEQTSLGLIHFHNKPFDQLLQSAREKLKLRIQDFKDSTLKQYNGAGKHLVKYFFMSESEYLESLPIGSIDISPVFSNIEMDVPFSHYNHTHDLSNIRALTSSVNIYEYYSRIVASKVEIDKIFELMLDSDAYLEFGCGGTTSLACNAGVQDIYSIETDIDFCRKIINDYSLDLFIQTGRLHLLHVDIGPTRAWGYPIRKPSEKIIKRYIDKARLAKSVDTVLIDGRYRVAIASAIYSYLPSGSRLLVHDYSQDRGYSVLEELYFLEDLVDTLALFRPRPGCSARAQELLNSFLFDPH